MLEDAYNFFLDKPWPMIPPGLAIALTVLAFNLVGDGLRDALGREVIKVKGKK
jgi:ABC-type dipeptide/oligopeptide/nickel transport system permease subunit